MKHSLRLAAVLTAAAVVLSGTALAESPGPDLLGTIFKGDTSSAEALVNKEVHTASNQDFTLTINSSVFDRSIAIYSVTIDARSDRAKEALSNDFSVLLGNKKVFVEQYFIGSAGNGESVGSGTSTAVEQEMLRTDSSCTYSVATTVPPNTPVSGVRFSIRFYQGEQSPLYVDFNLSPVDGIGLKVDASGDSTPSYKEPVGKPITVNAMTISPFSFSYSASWENGEIPSYPPILFLMKDGSTRTLTQSYRFISSVDYGSGGTHATTPIALFNSIMDISKISSVVLWGKEYPIDGGAPRDIEVASCLLPFRLPAVDPDVRLYDRPLLFISARDLVEALGGTCTWDRATRSATLVYQDVTVTLTEGSSTAIVDGQAVEMDVAPQMVGGKLCVFPSVLSQQWRIGCSICEPVETIPAEWVVVP